MLKRGKDSNVPGGDSRSGTVADWRRWAVLAILARDGFPAFRVWDLVHRMQDNGWGHLLPVNGRYDAVYRALLAEEKAGKVRRVNPRPYRWLCTDLGRDFTVEFIIGNPNITPEASRG